MTQRYSIIYRWIIILAICLAGSCKKQVSYKQDFVRVKGTQFYIGNKPYYFIGVNMFYAAYLGATPEGQQRLIKELDLLKSLGVNNLRILGASELSNNETALPEAIQPQPGIFNETLLKGLDFALAEMGKRGMYAVIFLNNFWNWSGGMAQYVSWVTNQPAPNPDKDQKWREYMNYSASFYSLQGAQELYFNYIKSLINRRNTYTGKQYKDDPTIMSWQLANEPRPGADPDVDSVRLSIFAKWVDTTTKFIYSLDTSHLISTGSEGIVGTAFNTDAFLRIHSSPYIHYANFHLWAKNWGWYNANNPDETFIPTLKKAKEYVQLHISLAQKLNKPITMEEFGLERDKGKVQPETSVTYRDKYFEFLFQLVVDNASKNAPIAGANIWAWGGYGKPTPIHQVNTKNPYSFLGDPLGEPQGLNSVFSTDSSTLEIIKRYANILNNMN